MLDITSNTLSGWQAFFSPKSAGENAYATATAFGNCPEYSGYARGPVGVVLILLGGFVEVVIIRDQAGEDHRRDQQRAVEQNAAPDGARAARQIGRNSGDQRRGGHAQPELPGPVHQVEVVLSAH